ncbi:bifunctional DNA primase/helicase, partial [Kurthia sibirica]
KDKGNDEPIILTEGAIDALSFEKLGFNAISLDSVNNLNSFIEKIKSDPVAKNKLFFTAFDNDDAGLKATNDSPYESIKIPSEYKDMNDWLIDSLENATDYEEGLSAMRVDIENHIELTKRPDSVMSYLEQSFKNDINELKSFRTIKSGFSNLDEYMNSIFPGLYVVGGISSVGKTTFVHQLADQVAAQGEHAIYFSLEQSRLEMVSKSLARESAKNDLNGALTSFSIRMGKSSLELEKSIESYSDTSKRVNIVEGNFGTTVDSIRAYIERYIQQNNVKPLVVVDYLQIIPGDNRMNDKQRTDYNVTELKRMSRDFNIPLFVISSLNRGNYLAPIDFESFKESGSIEYSADVVLGLQLGVIRDDIFNKEGKLKEKREKVAEAKAEPLRQIELVCLKNRNGTPSFSCSFTYYAKHDFYEPNQEATSIESWQSPNTKKKRI